MTDPITPSTIARLRELIAKVGEWPDLGPEDRSDGSFRCPLCDGQGDIDAEFVRDGRREYGNDSWFSIVGVQVYGVGDAMAAMEELLPLLIKHAPSLLDQLAAQAAEIEKWQRMALVSEEITDARISDLLEHDAQAKGMSFSDAAAVFQRKATRLQRECDVIRASRDDLEDERHRLVFKCEQAVNRVGELEAEVERLRSIHQDIGGIGGCADGSGMRAVAVVADANRRADKAEARVAELETLLREARVYICQKTSPSVDEAFAGGIVNRIDAAEAKREGGR